MLSPATLIAMFLVVNPSGNYWDGFGWSTQGKAFFSPAAATRSLCEEGEDVEWVSIIPSEEVIYNDSTEEISCRDLAIV